MQIRHLTKMLAVGCTVLLSTLDSQGSLVFSAPTNDIYIGITRLSDIFSSNTNWITNNIPIRWDDEIAITYLCKTGSVNLLIPLSKDIFIKCQMRDKDGNDISKTPLGELCGSQVQNFPAAPGMSSPNRMTMWSADPWSMPPSFGPLTRISANQLFQMKESGIYDLTLEVHLMKQHMQTNGWTWDHITIPPVTVKVEKP